MVWDVRRDAGRGQVTQASENGVSQKCQDQSSVFKSSLCMQRGEQSGRARVSAGGPGH